MKQMTSDGILILHGNLLLRCISTMPSANSQALRTVHLVGSTPLDDVDGVFRTFGAALPGCLERIPDGEVGERKNFVWFQRDAVFKANGIHLALKEEPLAPPRAFTDDELAEAESEVAKARERQPVLDLKYGPECLILLTRG